jgi:hypothetical protein
MLKWFTIATCFYPTVYVLPFSLSLYHPDDDTLVGLKHVAIVNHFNITIKDTCVVFDCTKFLIFFRTHNGMNTLKLSHLTPRLNPSTQRCLTRFSTGDFSS